MTIRTWIGDTANQDLASMSEDWSPSGIPQAGDSLTMSGGTMNVSGNQLNGDPLSFVSGAIPSPTIDTINATNDTSLNLAPPPFASQNFTSTVNIHDPGTLLLTANVLGLGQLNIDAARIRFIGDSTFEGSQQTFNADLTGNATITLNSASHFFDETMKINGSVSPSLTFKLNPGGPPPTLEIEHPQTFGGKIEMPDTPNGVSGQVLLDAVHATSGFVHNDLLVLFDGFRPVDIMRVNATDLHASQTDQGVTLSGATSFVVLPPPSANAIPLYHV